MHRWIQILLLTTAMVSLTACAQMCAPDQVAMAVARLTTLNADGAISLLDQDTTCGFDSDAVKDAMETVGDAGQVGSITFTVTDCEIDAGDGIDLEPNCHTDAYKTVKGKFKVHSATKTVTGVRMDGDTPILPDDDFAVTIEVGKTEFFDLEVTQSNSDVSMTWVDGSLTGKLYPRLAKNNTLGACSVATSHKRFESVIYAESNVVVHAPDDIEVAVGGSDLQGQFGQNKGKAEDGFIENDIRGTLTIWDTEYEIPVEGDEDGLDPEYDVDEFYKGDECKEDILVPVSFDCG